MADEEESGMVVAATNRALPLRVEPLADDRVPDGMTCLASYLGNRLIARCAVPHEAVESLERFELFRDPVHLLLAAREEPPGLQCRLFALVDLPEDAEDDDKPEPWAASVPGPAYEEAVRESGGDGDSTSPRQAMVFLGQIIRFDRDRKHRDNLAQEAADILRRIVEGEAVEVVDKVLEDLLDEPPPPA